MKNSKYYYKEGYVFIKAEQSPLFKLLDSLSSVIYSMPDFFFQTNLIFKKKGDCYKSVDFKNMELLIEERTFTDDNGKKHKGFMMFIVDHKREEVVVSKFIRFHFSVAKKDNTDVDIYKTLRDITDISYFYENPDEFSAFYCEFSKKGKPEKGKEQNLHKLWFNLSENNGKIDHLYISFFHHKYNIDANLKNENKETLKELKKRLIERYKKDWRETIKLNNSPYIPIFKKLKRKEKEVHV